MAGSDDKINFHDKGQTDASNNVYEKPHDEIPMFLIGILDTETAREMQDENDQYKAGQEHHKSQKG